MEAKGSKSTVFQPREVHDDESFVDRFTRKFQEDPLPIVGLGLTAAVLTRGIMAFGRADRNTSYRMMRYRVLFQGGTVLLILFSVFFRPGADEEPKQEADGTRPRVVDKRAFLDKAEEYKQLAMVRHNAGSRATAAEGEFQQHMEAAKAERQERQLAELGATGDR